MVILGKFSYIYIYIYIYICVCVYVCMYVCIYTMNDTLSAPSDVFKEEWEAIRELADDRNIVIEQPDKGSCVVVWCTEDYIKEANKQLYQL